MENPAE